MSAVAVEALPAPLTREIAEFAVRIGREGPPPEALPVVRLGFTDCAAVLLAGRGEPVTRSLTSYVRARGGTAESRMLLGAERTSAPLAALLNASAAHALDWDDYAFANHPSAVLVPAILAVADTTGADGTAMAAAYVAGYEAWAALMAREPDHLHGRGWHPTGLFGPIAAAVAAAVLLRLDADRARDAVAIAASHAGGIMANFGTPTKPYHGGKAAEAGITAAMLARHGLWGGAAAIEDRLGLLAALSPAGRVDRTTPMGLGREWRILKARLNIKKYPTVGASQRTIDSVVAWRRANAVDTARVVRVVPRISAKQAAVMPFHRPRNGLEAKFSLEFVVSAALLRGRLGLQEMTDGFVTSPEMQALMAKVEIERTEIYDPTYPIAAPEDFVRIRLDDGSEHVTPPVARATGHADRPLEPAELWTKFVDCAASAGVDEPAARRLFATMQAIDAQPSTAGIAVA
ncbi:MAG: MmgE/PrpD family protein [Alphaproteobacteria bacterium]|nr:MmgE/PrpD family protein [Alphaproteobacteria bacterium]